MLVRRKKTSDTLPAAKQVYSALLSHIRHPVFYTTYQIPDTFDGRFDLLLLHLFLVIERTLKELPEEAFAFNQALFDVTFADMDQTLREMGIGDMGVPKHMRRMMKAFNGRIQAYHTAQNTGTLPETLQKNLYGTCETIPPQVLHAMTLYVQDTGLQLSLQDFQPLSQGIIQLPLLDQNRK